MMKMKIEQEEKKNKVDYVLVKIYYKIISFYIVFLNNVFI